jgi:predicted DNA-binding protein
MSAVSLRMPESMHNRLRELSKREKTSINHLITLAVAEKLSALETMDYLEERAARADRKAFDKILQKVPDVEAELHDRIN